MGTTGRSSCLWLYFLFLLLSALIRGVAGTVIFALAMLMLASVLFFYIWYLPAAIRRSSSLGLNMIVLLPLSALWARTLLRLDGKRMNFRGAYEVHIKKGEKQMLGDYLRLFTSDLEIARRTFPGSIFMWETSAPLPLFVRRLIRRGSGDGTAFLKNGGWPAPRFPFTETELTRGRVKRGAIIA